MKSGTTALLRVATLIYALVGLAAWGWALLFGELGSLMGGSPATPDNLFRGLLVGVAISAACALGYRVSRRIRRAGDLLGSVLGPVSLPAAIYLALLSGFFEELLFRGALWPQLGLVGSTILFGILHTVPVRALALYPLFAAGCGLLLGLLREQSGSILPAVVAHVTVNAINLGVLGRFERRQTSAAQPAPAPDEPGRVTIPGPAPGVIDDPDPGEVAMLGDGDPAAMIPFDADYPITVWRYTIRLELTGTDRQSLPECLEHESLALFQHSGREEIYGALRSGALFWTASFQEPFQAFSNDLSTLSSYLFQTVTGIEVAERHTDETTTDDVRAWKVVAQRGEWVKVPLLVTSPEPGRFDVDPDRDNIEVIAAHWESYPRWFQDGMRFRYPRLR